MPSLTLGPTAGLGLKPQHYRAFLESDARGLWAEAHPENYMAPGGPRLRWLDAIRRERPLSLHGVALSLGGAERPDPEHLNALKALVDRFQPALVSEHLAWSAHDGTYFADLLPTPYTNEALTRFCDHVDETQTALGRAILIENPSLYLPLKAEMSEAEFLAETVRRTGCGLLLDINNVFVSARNLGRDAYAFIDALPAAAVGEYHLAGHAPDARHGEALLIDTHGAPVDEDVWDLFAYALEMVGPRPALIERDNDIPDFETLMDERNRAEDMLASVRRPSLLNSARALAHV